MCLYVGNQRVRKLIMFGAATTMAMFLQKFILDENRFIYHGAPYRNIAILLVYWYMPFSDASIM